MASGLRYLFGSSAKEKVPSAELPGSREAVSTFLSAIVPDLLFSL